MTRVTLKGVWPDQITDRKQHDRAMRKALEATAKDVMADFQKTTKTWRHTVKFTRRRGSTAGNPFSLNVGTNDKIYGYVNDGTRPHIIRAKKRALRFRGRSRAKTRPRYIGSFKGASSGKYVYRKQVRHPGTKPRLFDVTIQEYHVKRGTLQRYFIQYLGSAGG